MNTPICDFVKKYAQSDSLRMHMPGHKGKAFIGAEPLDITEIQGADVLYSASGIIKESEENAAKLFGTAKTVYSTEGCSLAIRAMLYLALLFAVENGKKPIIAAGRNAHKAFVSSLALLDFETVWLYPQEECGGIVSCNITPECLDASLSEMAEKPVAVYITSPDYLGNIADIAGLSRVCKKHGALLLVDNAHGAYLSFLPQSKHPIALGADLSCDSAHKTLPVLTGGAYLHISKNAPDILMQRAESAMSLFASTSPSYVILQSIDAVNLYLSGTYKEALSDFCGKASALKDTLRHAGYELCGDEMLKITFNTKSYGYTGTEFSDILYKKGIVCEFSDPDYTVLMLTPQISDSELLRLEAALLSIEKRTPISIAPMPMARPQARLTPREAMFSKSRIVKTSESLGKILADTNVSCPPAIPIAICGEVIDQAVLDLFEYYSIDHCRVIE